MSKIEQLIRSALKEANKSDSPNFRIGCAAYRSGRVIASARNEFVKTSPCTTNRSRKLHAEKNLAKHDLSNSTVLVLRLSGAGKVRMARPCIHCQEDLRHVKQILYTNSSGEVIEFTTGKILGIIRTEVSLSNFIPYFSTTT